MMTDDNMNLVFGWAFICVEYVGFFMPEPFLVFVGFLGAIISFTPILSKYKDKTRPKE